MPLQFNESKDCPQRPSRFPQTVVAYSKYILHGRITEIDLWPWMTRMESFPGHESENHPERLNHACLLTNMFHMPALVKGPLIDHWARRDHKAMTSPLAQKLSLVDYRYILTKLFPLIGLAKRTSLISPTFKNTACLILHMRCLNWCCVSCAYWCSLANIFCTL